MAKPSKLPFGSNNASKRLLSGAGGSIGAGHSTAGGTPLNQLVPGAKPRTDKGGGDNPTALHNFGGSGGPQGKSSAKGGGNAVPRRTAPGA